MEVEEEVCELKKLILEKDKKICLLERRVDELEQYMWMDNVTVSGLNTRHRSYTRDAAGAGDRGSKDDTPGETFSLEQQVLQFFTSKNINIDSNTISIIPSSKSETTKVPQFFTWVEVKVLV